MRHAHRAWLLFAFLACVVLRAPSFVYGVISDDEAIYWAMARGVAHGGVMYHDTVDHKPPGLVYTYAAVDRVLPWNPRVEMIGVHLVGLLAVMATCAVLAAIARRLLAERPALFAPLLYAVVSATKVPYDGLAVNGELLMNLPIALCVLCALEAKAENDRAWRALLFDVLAGAFASCAILYKYQAGLVLPALVALRIDESARWRARLRSFVGWPLGALLPLTLFTWYFRHRGVLAEAWFWGWRFNRIYLSDWPGIGWLAKRFGAQLAGVVAPSALIYAAGAITLVGLLRRARARFGATNRASAGAPEVTNHPIFLLVWTLLSLAAVFLGGRFFGHYFLQPELPLALCAAGPASRLFDRSKRLFVGALALPAFVFFLGALLPLRRPGAWLDADAPDYDAIGAAIADHTREGDTIWIWGNVPQLYFTSGRDPGVRFTFCNYLTGLSTGMPSEYDPRVDPSARAVDFAWGLVLDDLDRRKPALVVDTAAAGLKGYAKFPIDRYPPFARYLAAHYRRDGDAAGVPLYRRID